MPRLKHRVPKYCHHKASGQAVVTLDGRDHYLGPHGSPESKEAYDGLIAEWLAQGRRSTVAKDEQITIVEVVDAYLQHAQAHYRRPDGTATNELITIGQALRPLVELFGRTAAADFGPRKLKSVRQHMIDRGWCRTHINKQVTRVKTMFRWAVEDEMVPAQVHHGLLALRGLARGQFGVRESEPIKPVPEKHIIAVRPFVSQEIWAMIQLQLLTGMRPGEVVNISGSDLDTSGRVWVYRPSEHKTSNRGHTRIIYLGPKAQATIQPFLKRKIQTPLFSPAEAEKRHRRRRRAARKTPISCGNRPGTNRVACPKTKPSDRYDVASYRRAISRACDRAFPPPPPLAKRDDETHKEWKARLTNQEREQLKQWQKDHRWHPHQLRHNAATRLRKEFGIEIARIVLGHRSAAVTEIYAEVDHHKAADIMARIG